MEERIINALLDIKADIGGVKKDVGEIKEDVAVLKADMSDVKTTVNALAEGLLETFYPLAIRERVRVGMGMH